MDKETLSHYGWIVILVLILAVLLAFASPFGQFIADGFKATYTGLFQTGDGALNVGLSAVGVKNTYDCGHDKSEPGDHTAQKECGHYECNDCGCVPALCGIEGHWSGDGLDHSKISRHYVNGIYHEYKCQCDGWVVPEGGTFIMTTAVNGKSTYVAGEQLPCGYSLKDYDEYRYGDYRYYICNGYTSDNGWVVTINQEVTDKNQTSYGPILDRIYNRDVSILSETFSGCKNLIIAPAMPQYIERLYYTFSGCTALTTAPDISYCEQLKGMEFTFQGCTSMKTYTGSADTDGDFSNYTIPNSVTTMYYAFGTCKQMTHAPAIPENVYDMQGTFSYCTALTNAPDTTNARSIKTMYSCFMGCTGLSSTKNLVLPSTVTDIQWAFYNCTSLSGKITINSTPTSYGNSFYNVDMSKITFAGSCDASVKQAIANIGKNGSQVTIIN